MKKYVLLLGLTLCFTVVLTAQNRSIDGRGNNMEHKYWGSAGALHTNFVRTAFGDGYSEPSGRSRPNPRVISNKIFTQRGGISDLNNLSDYAWLWGQFIDHDITLVPDNHSEYLGIKVPRCDFYFDPNCEGKAEIPLFRSQHGLGTGEFLTQPRRYPNVITAYIDASAVYGSDEERANWLRSKSDGKLKTSSGNMLPYNTVTGEKEAEIDTLAPHMDSANPFVKKLFVAGDSRANENILLTSMHTLFMREHNRLCEELKESYPEWNDEQLYQRARKLVGAIMQSIVYNQWLPSLGLHLEPYTTYDASVNPNIMNVFSAAAYRYGHTTIGTDIMRLDESGNTIPKGNIKLRDAFFNPDAIADGGGLDPLFRGAATQASQAFDTRIIDDLRNFLFGRPGTGGMDLVSINIQRGRDRGLPDYNKIRKAFGLEPNGGFFNLSDDFAQNVRMRDTYFSVDQIDPWVGFLMENHMPNALFGETAMKIIETQFTALRDGDRFFYLNDSELSEEDISFIESSTLATVIGRNSDTDNLQENIFLAEPLQVTSVENVLKDAFAISPNPSNGYFVIKNSKNLNMKSVSVTDVSGKEYFLRNDLNKTGSVIVNLVDRHLPSGIYIIRITTSEGIHNEKLLIR